MSPISDPHRSNFRSTENAVSFNSFLSAESCNRLPSRIPNTSVMLLDIILEDFTICEEDIEQENPSQGRSHRE